MNRMANANCIETRDFAFEIKDLVPGKYFLNAWYYDYTQQNRIGEKTFEITVNGCEADNECDDGEFYTKDICVMGEEAKDCKSELDYVIIGSIAGGIILLLAVAIYLMKRK